LKYKEPLKLFLCIEDGDEFFLEAETMEQAKADVSLWGASVVKEVEREDENVTDEIR